MHFAGNSFLAVCNTYLEYAEVDVAFMTMRVAAANVVSTSVAGS